MSKRVYIYLLVDPKTNEGRYIGKTDNLKRRYSCHLANARLRDTHVHRWVYTLIAKGRKPKLRVLEITDEENWRAREQHWIKVLRNQGARLVNTSEGGKGGSGKHTPEAKEKISKARKGMKFSPEHRQRLKERKREFYNSERGQEVRELYGRRYGVLTDEQVLEVWHLAWEGKLTQRVIAEMYSIPEKTVGAIKSGRRYKYIKRPERDT